MKSSPGFSLPEVLIFVTIVAILFVVASPYLYSKSDYAKVGQAQVRLLAIESALNQHVQDWGSVPADYNDPQEPTLAFRVRSATSPICSWRGSKPKVSGIITFQSDLLAMGHYDLGIYCPLTTPIRYLEDEDTIDPFGDGTVLLGYDSKFGLNLQSAPVGEIILYGASFSTGPDRVAGDWLSATPWGGGPALAYSPTNGIRSRGEMWIVVPSPRAETVTQPHPVYPDWQTQYGQLRSFDGGDK